jgi:hypothetical protein
MYGVVSGGIDYLRANGFSQFLAFSKSQLDPLARKFEFVMDIWIVIDMALVFTTLILALME